MKLRAARLHNSAPLSAEPACMQMQAKRQSACQVLGSTSRTAGLPADACWHLLVDWVLAVTKQASG